MKEKQEIIYIVSNGRSGSTLLELILNSKPSLWTAGELNILPWELEKTTQLCGCGEEVKNCEFWKKVIDGIDMDQKTLSPFRDSHFTRKVVRFKPLLQILRNKNLEGEFFDKFCELNTNLLSQIKEAAQERKPGVNKIVSSSKCPYRLFWLSNCENVDIKAIHVIKDPRAFVYSTVKNSAGLRTFFKSLRMIIRYIVENWVITKVSRNLPKDNFRIIRYEDLASDPEKTMKELADWLDIEKEWNLDSFKEENHGVAGNMMRFEFKEIVLDKKWKKNLSPAIKFMTKIFTYFSAKKYGYFGK